jgi:hypothetical protein
MYNCESSSMTVTNCILWSDVPQEIYGGTIVTYSDVQGGWPGVGNIDSEPCFVNPDSNDYHLSPDSPCINAGDPNYVPGPNETDIDGEDRVMFGRIDMGADEFNPFRAEFVVVRKERINRTVFEYECQVSLTNLSRFAIENAQLEMLKGPENIIIIDPNVSFGPIEASGSATSIDTCTFRVDRSKAIDPTKIFWRSTCELEDNGQIIQHTLSSIINLEPEDTAVDSSKVNLAGLVGKWLWVGKAGNIPEDITGDGIVNLVDFAELAQKWQIEK